ncbi:ABC transporter ATP-binding protein [Virgibacillus oceani]|uniref:ABC transporter ATP-binding protein n=1 Tax=Virgibacillus oceani TaxID=1479511 RepID=A0A917GYA9_9BACI|nr:ABC transporter ATP-binding protein [Virgibacillus oceani]GGG61024.1 ABC transporter ATP-binding protein [Virgibacillus oceani]
MMELQNINLFMNDKNVLHSINLQWRKGESIALIGANGAGKSSLLKVLGTLVKPNSGKLKYPSDLSVKEWKKLLGIVFPETFLYHSLTAYENLRFYQKLYGKINKDRIDEVLKQVKLFHVKQEIVDTYSKGMKQRLSIARALLHNPTYLLLDEPFDGLDSESKEILKNMLLQMRQKGTGYILVSHDSEQAWELCDRAVLMHEGRIIAEGKCTNQGYFPFIKRYREIVKEKSS